MSLHRYLVPPPLALSISPAKPHPPPRTEKKSDDKEKDKAKHPDDDKKVEDKDKPIPKADDKVKLDPEAVAGGEIKTPGSMVPEPPTPADGPVDPDTTPQLDAAHKPDVVKLANGDAVPPKDKAGDEADKPKVPSKDSDKVKAEVEDKDAEKVIPIIGPKIKAEAEASDDPELEPEPLRLIGSPPKYPIRTRLDLDPSKPWPPVEPDPRGAYHLYAKGCYKGIIESVYIDVTKDGWMSEHWKEKSERDALEKLRGEDLRRAKRELEVEARRREVRKVPKKAGDVLLMLWNMLVEAPNNELSTETFWSAFDWQDPSAEVHTRHVPVEAMNENKSITVDGEEVEWTKDGVEQILATVGIQCVYNSDKPINRRYTDRYPSAFSQDRAFIILGHNHFMLRLREWLEFKPEDTAGKFEVLVTSGHDRIFGDMVKQQRMEARKKEELEYYKKKKAQKEKAEAEAKEKGKKGEAVDDAKEKKHKDGEDEPNKEKSDTSTKKVRDGVQVSNVDDHDAKAKEAHKDTPKYEEVKLMVAIPVKTDGLRNGDLDAKHDQVAILAGPGEAAAAKAEIKENKNCGKASEKEENKEAKKEVRDPIRDAEKIAEMMEHTGNLKMEDIQIALKVLEAASDKKDEKKEKKDEVGLIWTWGDSCERWRWSNWEAGVHDVGLGGWEERDWKVFADDRGVEEFEEDMEIAEVVEEDVHDWSC